MEIVLKTTNDESFTPCNDIFAVGGDDMDFFFGLENIFPNLSKALRVSEDYSTMI